MTIDPITASGDDPTAATVEYQPDEATKKRISEVNEKFDRWR